MTDPHPFIRRLYALAQDDDRAALAQLRRGFTHPLAAMPYVARFLRPDASRRDEQALLLVGALFGLHPTLGGTSLATALRRLSDQNDSIALRFRALLDADLDDLPTHLRHAISLARSHDLPIDYDDLLRAVRSWSREDKSAQRAWARHFWGAAPSGDTTTTETETPHEA
jgi:CRISPR type I-E-associated protein CasB/Cse2